MVAGIQSRFGGEARVLDSPRGYCAGVERAVETVEEALGYKVTVEATGEVQPAS